jgi:ATP-dependent helicase/DNAse subunit B
MPITLITGPANAGKARAVLDAVRRHLVHGEEPLLVVPTRADAELYLRELAGAGAVTGVRVERFAGLLGELVRRAGHGQALLGTLARERVLAAVAARAGATDSPGFLAALGELFAELRVRRVSPARLADTLSRADRDASLGRLFGEYCRTLGQLGRVDGEQRTMGALDELRVRPALWGSTPVLFYGFDDLTALQLDVIETLGRVVQAPVTVSLSYEPGRVAFAGRASSFHALAPLAAEHRALAARAEHYAPVARGALSHLERFLFEPARAPAGRVDGAGALRLLEGGGERAELELVAGELRQLLDEGAQPSELAVLVRPGGTDVGLLEEVFADARIPFALQRRRPFAASAVGRALIGLLRCVPAPDGQPANHRSDGSLDDLLAWLRAPGLLRASPAHGPGPTLADRLEISARRAGAHDAVRARALWEQRNWPLESIDRMGAAQGKGAAALCEHAARELQRLFCAPRREQASVLGADERDEASALAVGRRALGELRELARSAPALAPVTAIDLAALLERLELVSDTGSPAAAPGAGAVAVLDPLALRARRVRALFVCGLQEGVFPARARQQPLLGEDERRCLAEVSGLRLGEPDAHSPSRQLAAERYLLYAAVSRPRERLYLSWHACDDDGETTSRSLFVDDVCDLFEPSLLEGRARRALGALERPPPGGAVGAGGHVGSGVRALDAPAGAGGGVLRDQRVLALLRERPWSASSLERWIGCPMSWFVERLLRPDALEPDPEPLARGGLAHAALKDTLEGLRVQTGSARVSPAKLALARELLAAALADNEGEHPLSVSPERRVAVRRRLHADLERYLEHAAAAPSPLEPSALELGFGFGEGDPGEQGAGSELPALELGDGVRLRGRIDRVDMGERGEAVVYDYKGGRAPAGARWIADGSVQVALYMHAVEQLMGVEAAGGFYQPLTGEDLRARGVLDGDAGIELDCVANDVLEHAEVRELLEQALALAREAAAQAARGELEARPQTCAFRGGCMYPAICRCER